MCKGFVFSEHLYNGNEYKIIIYNTVVNSGLRGLMVIDRYQYSKYGNVTLIFQISCVLFIEDGVQDGRQCIVRFRKLCKLVDFISIL